jgi:hypothetical protein
MDPNYLLFKLHNFKNKESINPFIDWINNIYSHMYQYFYYYINNKLYIVLKLLNHKDLTYIYVTYAKFQNKLKENRDSNKLCGVVSYTNKFDTKNNKIYTVNPSHDKYNEAIYKKEYLVEKEKYDKLLSLYNKQVEIYNNNEKNKIKIKKKLSLVNEKIRKICKV